MRIAIPVWNDRISPVFDTSRRLLVVDFSGNAEVSRVEHEFVEPFSPVRVRRLREIGIELLICGAVSNPVACLIEAAGIGIVPWVSGNVDEVLGAFAREQLTDSRYRMPGCRGRERGFRRGGRCAWGGRGYGSGGRRGGWREMERNGEEGVSK